MKKENSTLLFIISFAVLIALQVHYIYTSYKLEEKEFNRQINIIANTVLAKMDRYDDNRNEANLIKNMSSLSYGSKSQQKEKIQDLKELYILKKYYKLQVDTIIKKHSQNTGYKIALKSEVYSIYDKLNNREILSKNEPIVLFKTTENVKNGNVINEGIWNSNQSQRDTELKKNDKYHFIIKSNATVELLNMQSLIFKKIAFLIILSILITGLLAYIFWKSLKNLKLQQQKIAQLHTTIDSIAHELNTPLTTIKFALQTSPNSESRTIIERQAQRIEKVVSSIHHQTESSNLLDKNSLETYLNHIKKQYNNLSININTTYAYNKVLAQNHFEEMMNNLIENASKYKANKVDIAVKFDKQIEISIADNGIGIPLEEQKHIFEKYYRVSRAENMQINGLGIGLYLVNEVVKNHNGTIEVETNTTQGVTFKINIPNEN